jgi:hypothetical protein
MKVCKREKLAYEYGNLFTEALKIVNYRKKLLYTIWDDIGEDPFEIYVPYIMTPNKLSFSSKNKLNSIW